MTYGEFRDKYNGKRIDYDGYYGTQCWDLAQQYFVECLGLPEWVLSGCGNVKNMLVQPKLSDLLTYFEEIPLNAMCPGDVCIWSSNHIAIFDHWDGANNWYFSQNPNEPKLMTINMSGLHAFRLKSKFTTVARDENKNQIEVKVPQLNCRINPNVGSESVGFAKQGIYNYTDKANADGYDWYYIGKGWIAYTAEWCNLYPKKVEIPKEEIDQDVDLGSDQVEIPSVEEKEEDSPITPEQEKTNENEQKEGQKPSNIFIRIIQFITNIIKQIFKASTK